MSDSVCPTHGPERPTGAAQSKPIFAGCVYDRFFSLLHCNLSKHRVKNVQKFPGFLQSWVIVKISGCIANFHFGVRNNGGQLFGHDTSKHNEQEVGAFRTPKKKDTVCNSAARQALQNQLGFFFGGNGGNISFNHRIHVLFSLPPPAQMQAGDNFCLI